MFDSNTNFKHLSLKSSDWKVFKIMRNLNSFKCVQTFVYITTILDQYQKPPLLLFSFVVSLSTATFIPTVHMKRERAHTHKNSTGATGFCIWSAVKAKPLKHFDKHTPLVLQVKCWSIWACPLIREHALLVCQTSTDKRLLSLFLSISLS